MVPVDPRPTTYTLELRSIVESLAEIQTELLHSLQSPGTVGSEQAILADLAESVRRAEHVIRQLNHRLSLLLHDEIQDAAPASETRARIPGE